MSSAGGRRRELELSRIGKETGGNLEGVVLTRGVNNDARGKLNVEGLSVGGIEVRARGGGFALGDLDGHTNTTLGGGVEGEGRTVGVLRGVLAESGKTGHTGRANLELVGVVGILDLTGDESTRCGHGGVAGIDGGLTNNGIEDEVDLVAGDEGHEVDVLNGLGVEVADKPTRGGVGVQVGLDVRLRELSEDSATVAGSIDTCTVHGIVHVLGTTADVKDQAEGSKVGGLKEVGKSIVRKLVAGVDVGLALEVVRNVALGGNLGTINGHVLTSGHGGIKSGTESRLEDLGTRHVNSDTGAGIKNTINGTRIRLVDVESIEEIDGVSGAQAELEGLIDTRDGDVGALEDTNSTLGVGGHLGNEGGDVCLGGSIRGESDAGLADLGVLERRHFILSTEGFFLNAAFLKGFMMVDFVDLVDLADSGQYPGPVRTGCWSGRLFPGGSNPMLKGLYHGCSSLRDT